MKSIYKHVMMPILLISFIGCSGQSVVQKNNLNDTPKPLIVNDDGYSVFFANSYSSPETFRKKILQYKETNVKIFEFCVTVGRYANYKSKATTIFGGDGEPFPRSIDSLAAARMRVFVDEGKNPLEVAGQACHEIGIKCFAGFRMAPDYDIKYDGEDLAKIFNGKFWWDHPEYRVRDRKGNDLTKMSFAFKEVRQFWLSWIREVLTLDVDGINLDFLRHPPFVGYETPAVNGFIKQYKVDPRTLNTDDPRWLEYEAEIMSGFMAQLHSLLRTDSIARGRNLEVSIRIDQAKYKSQGLDIERWIKEGYVDILIVAQEALGGYVFDLKPFVKMVKGSKCKVFFGEEGILTGHDLTSDEDRKAKRTKTIPSRRQMSLDEYCERARRWYDEGADGIYIFNDSDNYSVLKILGDTRKFPTKR